MDSSNQPANSHAVASLIFGILTILAFCSGWMPLPLTSLVCFPFSFLSAMLALVFGTIGLTKARKQNFNGGSMAWAGIVIGGFTLLCVLCMAASAAGLYYFYPEMPLPTPEFFKDAGLVQIHKL